MPSRETEAERTERSLRIQIKELERQAYPFNESLGLLRASLQLSSEGEEQDMERLQKVHHQRAVPAQPQRAGLALAQHLLMEQWLQHLQHTHVLRRLYNQLLETKRQYLHHWKQLLQERIEGLPTDRQPLLQSMLDNTLQGLLAVGVNLVEERARRELAQLSQSAVLPEGLQAPEQSDMSTVPHEPAQFDDLLQQCCAVPQPKLPSEHST